MNKIWIIAKRELRSFFDSLMAYVIIVLFLGFSGFFTWIFGSDIFLVGQASLQSFFGISFWTLFFFIPAITMGLLAEERKSGTLELLVTKPVSDWQIIAGKFLAAFLLICITLSLTLPYYITVASIGKIDHSAVLMGYLGLLFMSAAGGWFASLLGYLSLATHYESMARGVIDSKDILYFISIILGGLLGTELVLSRRRYSN
jgi:ABC-2 type transport system permease protein